jgi:hypothetical protein
MDVEITTESDDNFKILTKQFGKVFVATDGERVAIEEKEELAIEAVGEMQELARPAKIAAPIENAKGLGWFDGTSWGTK